jgi:hypothetical protein
VNYSVCSCLQDEINDLSRTTEALMPLIGGPLHGKSQICRLEVGAVHQYLVHWVKSKIDHQLLWLALTPDSYDDVDNAVRMMNHPQQTPLPDPSPHITLPDHARKLSLLTAS